jgi:hypothetical protein
MALTTRIVPRFVDLEDDVDPSGIDGSHPAPGAGVGAISAAVDSDRATFQDNASRARATSDWSPAVSADQFPKTDALVVRRRRSVSLPRLGKPDGRRRGLLAGGYLPSASDH